MSSKPSPSDEESTLPEIDVSGLELLGRGISGEVFALDETSVVKKAPSSDNNSVDNESLQDLLVERKIYQRLGDCSRICKYKGPIKHGIILERLGYNLRKHLFDLRELGKVPSACQAKKWSRQIIDAVAYTHSRSVIHGDLGCHNFLLDADSNLKMCDFGGASIDACPLRVCYGVRFQRHCDDHGAPSIQNEIFALGSTLYEVWMAKKPYEEEKDEVVKEYYRKNQFPEPHDLPVAHVISKCWKSMYGTVNDIALELDSLGNT